MKNTVFVTGVGMVGPCGNSAGAFWEGLLSGRNYMTPLQLEGTTGAAPPFAGQVSGMEPERVISKRLLKKCSRFSVMSILAAKDAMDDAHWELDQMSRERIGIFVGNNSGGWESARNGLRVLHTEGAPFIDPNLASNWFPAAAQGHMSLAFGIKGYSKTVIADRSSGLLAIAYAARAIRSGIIDAAIVGGAETPLDPWALSFYNTEGLLNLSADRPQTAYRPFVEGRSGLALAEGAAFLCLESERSIQKREASRRVRASIQGFGFTNDGQAAAPPEESVAQCARAIRLAIGHSETQPEQIGYLSLDGAASAREDGIECSAIQEVFSSSAEAKWAGCPKTVFGNTIGAAGAFDVALGVLAMNHGELPGLPYLAESVQDNGLNFVPGISRRIAVESSLILSRGRGGVSSALVVNAEGL
ncbi:beta-ketoacyl-[acyl-carrier-protein] synthase family protein [Paenibacillus rhizoplanae]|uniref:Beta-ketoacyl-[acyl-carrier-protein] synthase family protein n=1 Tax=Paenibacillus rhizoplanae TaxID=1917181 RepID=A0ABW5FAG3_9BACL